MTADDDADEWTP